MSTVSNAANAPAAQTPVQSAATPTQAAPAQLLSESIGLAPWLLILALIVVAILVWAAVFPWLAWTLGPAILLWSYREVDLFVRGWQTRPAQWMALALAVLPIVAGVTLWVAAKCSYTDAALLMVCCWLAALTYQVFGHRSGALAIKRQLKVEPPQNLFRNGR